MPTSLKRPRDDEMVALLHADVENRPVDSVFKEDDLQFESRWLGFDDDGQSKRQWRTFYSLGHVPIPRPPPLKINSKSPTTKAVEAVTDTPEDQEFVSHNASEAPAVSTPSPQPNLSDKQYTLDATPGEGQDSTGRSKGPASPILPRNRDIPLAEMLSNTQAVVSSTEETLSSEKSVVDNIPTPTAPPTPPWRQLKRQKHTSDDANAVIEPDPVIPEVEVDEGCIDENGNPKWLDSSTAELMQKINWARRPGPGKTLVKHVPRMRRRKILLESTSPASSSG